MVEVLSSPLRKRGQSVAISKAVLITGCSTGIGRASAERLAERGWTVYATARRVEDIADLEAKGCRILSLDVTDERSMARAVAAVEAAEGAVGALVNNAGYGQQSAFEETPIDDVRRQFETNVFGLVRMTQLVLPKMRDQGWGRIVNMSSMGGRLSLPGGAFYHATKHAVEAMSDSLRFETRPFGIHVAIVEPGPIKTRFGDTALETLEKVAASGGPYRSLNAAIAHRVRDAYQGSTARFAAPPSSVAKAVEHAIGSRKPRTRYRVTFAARVMLFMRRVLPDRAFDAVIRSQYRAPRDD
jgi:short-subunit dehydrogenase